MRYCKDCTNYVESWYSPAVVFQCRRLVKPCKSEVTGETEYTGQILDARIERRTNLACGAGGKYYVRKWWKFWAEE